MVSEFEIRFFNVKSESRQTALVWREGCWDGGGGFEQKRKKEKLTDMDNGVVIVEVGRWRMGEGQRP